MATINATPEQSQGNSQLYENSNVSQQTQLISQPLEENEKVVFGRITLNKGISQTNFYTSWAYVIYLGFVLISFTTLEPEYLSAVLKVSEGELGSVTANLYLWDYLIRLFFTLIYGVMIDEYGRKFVMVISLILASLGYFVVPLLSSSLFPAYYLAKAVYSSGISGLQLLPFAADYVHDSTKGTMTCFTFGVASIGGGIAAGIIKVLLLLDFEYKVIYWIMAALIIVFGVLLSFGIKGGNTYYKIEKEDNSIEIMDSSTRWQEVKKAFREVPWITIALLFGTLGITDLYIMTTALIIWIKGLLPPDQDPTVAATSFQAIFFGLSVIVTGFLAFKVDKVSHMKMIFPVLILSTLGFTFIPFITNPFSVLSYLFFVVEGLSLPGTLVYSTYLSARYNPPKIRGTISGLSNAISFLGAILTLTAGGYLRDSWRKDAAFIIYLGLLAFTLVVVTFLYFKKIKYEDEQLLYNSSRPSLDILAKV